MQHHQDIYTQPDEIDLFELAEKLVKEKFLILGVTIAGGLLASLVAFMQPKIYSSETVINLAPMSNFAKINATALLIENNASLNDDPSSPNSNLLIDNEQVFSDYQNKLTSFDTVQYAFTHTEAAQSINQESPSLQQDAAMFSALDSFQSSYSVTMENKANSPDRVTIRIKSNNPEEPVHLINNVVLPYAQSYVTEQLETDRRVLIEQEVANITRQIIDLEFSFLTNQKITIIELEEALNQARSAGITEPLTSDFNAAVLGEAQYLLGENLLSAQLETLNKRIQHYRYFSDPRANDGSKPFIRGVAEKVAQLQRLKQVDTDFSELSPVIIERKAEVALFPDEPNKKLIISMGIILAGMLGVFIALIRIAIQSRKKRTLALGS